MIIVGFEGSDQSRLIDDWSTGYIRNERISLTQDFEFFFAEKMCRFLGQRHGNEQMIDVLCKEMVQVPFVCTAVPCAWDFALGIACMGNDEAGIVLAFWGGAWTGGICNDVHSHCFCDVANLTADTTVAEDAETLADFIM